MKTKYVITTTAAIWMLLPLSMNAQKHKHISLHEGTDSAVRINVSDKDVWIRNKDSLVIMRKDLWDTYCPTKKRGRRIFQNPY